jgi:hypothetical protein
MAIFNSYVKLPEGTILWYFVPSFSDPTHHNTSATSVPSVLTPVIYHFQHPEPVAAALKAGCLTGRVAVGVTGSRLVVEQKQIDHLASWVCLNFWEIS